MKPNKALKTAAKRYAEVFGSIDPRLSYYEYQGHHYQSIFVTVDAIVFAFKGFKRYVLMIKRKDNGKYALPGGFVNYDEPLLRAAIRELKEETNLKFKLSQMRFSGQQTYDDPKRTKKGNRRITTAFTFIVPNASIHGFPKLKAGDDASCAFWMKYEDLLELKASVIHDDHRDIIIASKSVGY